MRTTARLSVVAAAAGILSVAGAPLAVAQTACDEYSQECVANNVVVQQQSEAQAPVAVQQRAVPTTSSPATLPFTGGEVVGLAVAGGLALATGGVLVRAGRRRGSAVA